MVEERDAIAKVASNARWRSAIKIRQLEGKLHSEQLTVVDLDRVMENER